MSDRDALRGILFVLQSGIPWEMLPLEMGCGSGMTCWRRLREWQEAGVWEELHARLLDKLAQADKLDWSRVSVDSASVAAPLAPKRDAGGSGKKGDVMKAKNPSAASAAGKKQLKPSGRIQRIAANRERSAMLWSTKEASR